MPSKKKSTKPVAAKKDIPTAAEKVAAEKAVTKKAAKAKKEPKPKPVNTNPLSVRLLMVLQIAHGDVAAIAQHFGVEGRNAARNALRDAMEAAANRVVEEATKGAK